jgi:hypothetical protein
MLFICFILIILVLIFTRIGLYKETKNINSFNSKFSELENGDLVFVSYNNGLGKIVKVWSGSKWTHVGMIFKNPDNGNLSVLEVAEYNNPNFEKGVIEVPLRAWLKMNEDFEIGYMKINTKISSYELYDLFEKYQGKKLYKLSMNPNKIKGFIFPSLRFNHKNLNLEDLNHLSCVDFVVLMLKDLKLIKSSFNDITTVSDIIDYLDDIVEKEGNTGKCAPVGKLT